jgi:hypothetical protein
MATVAARHNVPVMPATGLPGRRFDHFFFSGMALLLLGTVFVGFAPTYYMAGVFHAPLPSVIIHVHGAVFTCWILMLVTQTSLVAAGRVDIHRRLGIAGFLLACVMMVLGVLAATDSLVRGGGPPGLDPRIFYIVPLTDMMIFATLIFFAFHFRSNPAMHKRLILIATIGLSFAALARWPIAFVHRKPVHAALASYIFLVLVVAYDLWSTHRLQRVTLWAGIFLVVVQQIRVPLAMTGPWLHFAGWVRTLAG